MKKILAITLTLLLTMSLVACGGEKETQNNKPSNETIAEITDDTTIQTEPQAPSEDIVDNATTPSEEVETTTPTEVPTVPKEEESDESKPSNEKEEDKEVEYTETNKQEYYENYFNGNFKLIGETFASSKQISSIAFRKGLDGTIAARVDKLGRNVEIYIDANKQQYIKSGDKAYKFTDSDEHKNLIEEYNINNLADTVSKLNAENIDMVEYVMTEYERDILIITLNDGAELDVYVDINNHKIVRIDDLTKVNGMPTITSIVILENPANAIDISLENIESDPAVRDELLNLFLNIIS